MNIAGLTTGLAICASLFLSGCSISGIAGNNVSVEGNDGKATVKKSVNISDFNEIEASQAIKVIYEQSKNTGIAEISTTPSAEKYLKVEVKDKVLKVYYTNTENHKYVKIKGPSIIRVSSPELNEVDLSSAANVTIEGDLKLKGNFELDLSSASSFNARNITCSKLDADLSSSASAQISNLTGNLEADLSSASTISFEKVKGNVDLECSSAASIDINTLIASTVSAEASSAGSISISGISGGSISSSASSGAKIKLSGNADTLRKDESSGGSVNHSKLTLKH
ncbi:MAG: DUF2807 domain-containing protein [Muribaculaceae bacterium]|nr:DUF2807 domain-containing protein [Muribaculaceae bacterium]